MIAIYLGILVTLLTAAYLAGLCIRGLARGVFPPNGGRATIVRRTNPVRFWIAEVAVAFAVAALGAVGSLFVLAIMTARS